MVLFKPESERLRANFLIYMFPMIFYLALFGGFIIKYGKQLDAINDPPTDYFLQVKYDWDTIPFTELTVTDEWVCPEGQTEIFTHPWYGMKQACDCTGKTGRDSSGNIIAGSELFNNNEGCTDNQISIDCKNNTAQPVIWQNQFYGMRVCGTQGGDPFLNVTRPSGMDGNDGKCPSNTQACSIETQANNTICYAEDEQDKCPITDIQIIDTTAVSLYEAQGYTSIVYNTTASLVYSKTTNSLPPTSILVEYEPCMNPTEMSISPREQFYKPEVLQAGCTEQVNTQLVNDPRYSVSGLYTTVYNVQSENEVLDMLEAGPDYKNQVTTSTKENDNIRSWNRPTLNWSLECQNDNKGRQFAYDVVQSSIVSSSKMGQITKLGFGFCAIFSIFAVPAICGCSFSVFTKDSNYDITSAMCYVFAISRLAYVIMAPILGVAIYQSLDQNLINQEKIANWDYVVGCMDEYSSFYLDTEQVSNELASQTDMLQDAKIWWWVSMAFCFFEVSLVICVLPIMKLCEKRLEAASEKKKRLQYFAADQKRLAELDIVDTHAVEFQQ